MLSLKSFFPESCISCNSKDDPNCAQKPGTFMPKDCSTHDLNVQCYSRIVGKLNQYNNDVLC